MFSENVCLENISAVVLFDILIILRKGRGSKAWLLLLFIQGSVCSVLSSSPIDTEYLLQDLQEQ